MEHGAKEHVPQLSARAEHGGDGVPVGTQSRGEEAGDELHGRPWRGGREEDVVSVHGREGHSVEHLAGAMERPAAAVEQDEVGVQGCVRKEPADQALRVDLRARGKRAACRAPADKDRETPGGGRQHSDDRWTGCILGCWRLMSGAAPAAAGRAIDRVGRAQEK
jgi:hypothetical protein